MHGLILFLGIEMFCDDYIKQNKKITDRDKCLGLFVTSYGPVMYVLCCILFSG